MTKKTLGITLGIGLLSIVAIVIGGTSSGTYAKNAGIKGDLMESTNYQDFLQKSKGTKFEGKVSEERFESMKQKIQERQEKKEKLDKAFENKDFESWKEIMKENNHPGRLEMLEKIDTQEKFEKLAEMHKIMNDARAKADAIRAELGIEKSQKNFMKKGNFGKKCGMGKKNGGNSMFGNKKSGNKRIMNNN